MLLANSPHDPYILILHRQIIWPSQYEKMLRNDGAKDKERSCHVCHENVFLWLSVLSEHNIVIVKNIILSWMFD